MESTLQNPGLVAAKTTPKAKTIFRSDAFASLHLPSGSFECVARRLSRLLRSQ
jgi:hypothetical protein